jgi:hypothetical protein
LRAVAVANFWQAGGGLGIMISVSVMAGTRDAGRGVRLAAGVLALVVVVAGVFAVWYRATYSAWPGFAPGRVHWCGRDYQPGETGQTWHQITAQELLPIRAEGQYPPLGWWGQELFAVSPHMVHGPGEPCAMVLYLRTGPGSYAAYSLEGGP